MFAWLVQIIRGLDNQSKFQMFTLFSGRYGWCPLGGTPTRQFHTGLCKFVQDISTNIWRSLTYRLKTWRGVLIIYLLWRYNWAPEFLEFIHWIVFEYFLIAWRSSPNIGAEPGQGEWGGKKGELRDWTMRAWKWINVED